VSDRPFPDDDRAFQGEPGTGPRLAVYLRLAWLNEAIWYALRLRTALDADALLLMDEFVSGGAVQSALDGFRSDLRLSEREADWIVRSWREGHDVVALEPRDERLAGIQLSAATISPHLKVFDDMLEAIDMQEDSESRYAKRVLQATGGLQLHDFIAGLRLESDSEPNTRITRDEFRQFTIESVDALERAVSTSRIDLLPPFAHDFFHQAIDKARGSAFSLAVDEVLAQTTESEMPLRKVNRSIFRRVRDAICPIHPFC
jgi:hypothetical protein